jgi:hypothetical protein
VVSRIELSERNCLSRAVFLFFFNWNKENKHQVNVIHVYLRTVQSFRVWEMDNLAVALMQKNSFILPQIVLGFLSWLGLGMVKWFETYQFGRAPYWVGVIIFGSVRFLPLKNNQTRRQKKKDPNRTRTSPNRPVWVRFFRPKTGKTYGYFSGFVMGF